jgi:hypothetical protein
MNNNKKNKEIPTFKEWSNKFFIKEVEVLYFDKKIKICYSKNKLIKIYKQLIFMNDLSDKKRKKQWTLYGIMLMFFKPNIFWDWRDFGLVLKVYKQNNIGRYYFAIDIQIAWFNLWLQCWKKN